MFEAPEASVKFTSGQAAMVAKSWVLEKLANKGSVPYSIHATAGILGPPTVAIPFKVADTVWPRESIENRVTVGARVWVAIPVTGIAWGLPTVLSVTVNVVLLVPAAVGEKLI